MILWYLWIYGIADWIIGLKCIYWYLDYVGDEFELDCIDSLSINLYLLSIS